MSKFNDGSMEDMIKFFKEKYKAEGKLFICTQEIIDFLATDKYEPITQVVSLGQYGSKKVKGRYTNLYNISYKYKGQHEFIEGTREKIIDKVGALNLEASKNNHFFVLDDHSALMSRARIFAPNAKALEELKHDMNNTDLIVEFVDFQAGDYLGALVRELHRPEITKN